MNPNDNNDYVKNSILFLTLTFILIFGWNFLYPPAQNTTSNTDVSTTNIKKKNPPSSLAEMKNSSKPVPTFKNSKLITVTTDNYIAQIDEATGDIHRLELLKHKSNDDTHKNMVLLDDKISYIAQSRLINFDNQFFLDSIPFKAPTDHYELNHKDKIEVTLTKEADNVKITKTLTFKKNSYLIDFKYQINNNQSNDLNLTAMYRLLHNGTPAGGQTLFTKFYTGPVIYTNKDKFSKIPFENIAENTAKFAATSQDGWLGIIQHYFASIFILQPKGFKSVCQPNNCHFYFNQRQSDKLYEIAFTTPITTIPAKGNQDITVKLFSGPQEYKALNEAADNLNLVKDFGIWHIFANPLFLVLQFIETFIGNWGWAIIILVLLLKIILYPLNSASTKSMAKMRQITPKMQAIREQYSDDKIKMQQEIMELYRKEKINPFGGCLPMLIQIPIFIGLYWALFNSVDLRGAPWIGWITDLSRQDPYYILPIIMATTMYIQTHLNPPPADPMQAKIIKILPLIFSIMFFFFPSGLVLYWIVNNILTIIQQWYINKSITKQKH